MYAVSVHPAHPGSERGSFFMVRRGKISESTRTVARRGAISRGASRTEPPIWGYVRGRTYTGTKKSCQRVRMLCKLARCQQITRHFRGFLKTRKAPYPAPARRQGIGFEIHMHPSFPTTIQLFAWLLKCTLRCCRAAKKPRTSPRLWAHSIFSAATLHLFLKNAMP